LHQDVEFGAVFVYRTSQQVRFPSQRDEHLIKVPRATGLAPRGLHPVSQVLAELVAPASDRLVCHDHPTLKEQFLDIASSTESENTTARHN
jgi:hypothetical protein